MIYRAHPIIQDYQDLHPETEVELPPEVVDQLGEVIAVYAAAENLSVINPKYFYIIDLVTDVAQATIRGLQKYGKANP